MATSARCNGDRRRSGGGVAVAIVDFNRSRVSTGHGACQIPRYGLALASDLASSDSPSVEQCVVVRIAAIRR